MQVVESEWFVFKVTRGIKNAVRLVDANVALWDLYGRPVRKPSDPKSGYVRLVYEMPGIGLEPNWDWIRQHTEK